jgi:4-hydroxy-3-polyprenylbenzoate decarboxylase
LHFQTETTIDTLDYSGTGLNQGSKVVIAAAGPPVRKLATEIPATLSLPEGYRDPRVCLPGILAVSAQPYPADRDRRLAAMETFCQFFGTDHSIRSFPVILLVDDSEFTARTLSNFLWTTFTRSNPAADIHGIDSFTHDKHWGCRGPIVIDARAKPHHAPPLIEDPEITKRVDALAAGGSPLAKWL